MRPLFHPHLINDVFGDPGVYVDCMFEKQAMLFDLGDISRLAPRKILRLNHVFVSHTHMDHFIGFDWLLRICLGREKIMHLYGPPGFLAQVEHRLAAYTWNLVANYTADFVLIVTEINQDHSATRASFHCRSAFRREDETQLPLSDNILLDKSTFRVRYALLDHKTPCLAFALEEKAHINIWKNRLDELGLPTGAWLRELKQAIMRGDPDDAEFCAWWRQQGEHAEKCFTLGELKTQIVQMVPGQKIAYVTDVTYHQANASKIIALASNADILFIETTFLQQDAARAAEKYHLTAQQAGLLARKANVISAIPFHVSPRYTHNEAQVRQEFESAFSGS